MSTTRTQHCIGLVLSLLLGLALQWSSAQSNLISNGSFEAGVTDWSHEGIFGLQTGQGAAEGTNAAFINGSIWQDLATTAGQEYVISFAVRQSAGFPQVTWGSATVGSFTWLGAAGAFGNYWYIYIPANADSTRVRFENSMALIDDVRVAPTDQPIHISSQPESRSAFEGSTIGFTVNATATPPLTYQWHFNGEAIDGATGRSFTLEQVRRWQAGAYSVIISNNWRSQTSDTAQLNVEPPPTTPIILSQPAGDLFPAGYAATLQVVAAGAPPLRYEWSWNGTNLAHGTNRTLFLESVQPTNAGSYAVRVSNDLGSVLSLPAVVSVTNVIGGGRIIVDTLTNNAPAYDVDGSTRLTGPSFMAQVYAGATPTILRPLGASIPFRTGSASGYVFFNRTTPDVVSGETAYVQVRAWEASFGTSYEDARARGGKYGSSPIASVRTGGSARAPIQSFKLRAGEPFFVTGRLTISAGQQGQQLTLTGEQGARYLVETQRPPNEWIPLLVLTNSLGSTTFSDPDPPTQAVQFYRARLLD